MLVALTHDAVPAGLAPSHDVAAIARCLEGRGWRPLLVPVAPSAAGVREASLALLNASPALVLNLALGPEQNNGDNLLVIRDPDVVTAFAIEAFRLVDHFQFRDKDNRAGGTGNLTLHIDSNWVTPYFINNDMKSRERNLLTADQPNQ